MTLDALKVSTRLALGFGIAILLGVVIAVLATVQMQRMAGSLDEVGNDRMVKMEQFGNVQDNLNIIALAVRNIVINPDPAYRATQHTLINATRARNSELLATLDKTVNLPRSREMLKVIADNRADNNKDLDRVMALAEEGKNDEARELLLGTVQSRLETIYKAVDEATAAQTSTGKKLAADASSSAGYYAGVMAVLAIAMAAVGGLLAWTITRSLTRALGAEPAQVNAAVQRVAEGDLNTPIALRERDTTSLMALVKHMQESLTRTVSSVRSNAEGVASASAQIAQGNNDLSARTEQQASALEETAASMEELSSTVKQNADNARQANQLAQNASTVAIKGGSVVSEVVETMKGINDSSKKIADIISVIDGIAFQTNILALNAAVEAARAGEQGRGFAVVASEVRSLAGRSAQAAKEIKELIGASVQRVEQGTTLVDQAGVTMTEVVNSIRRVTDIMGEISAASSEQSSGVSQVGEAVTQMDQATQQNAALVEEMAAAASSLRTQADDLVGAVAVFKLPAGPTAVQRPPVYAAPPAAPRAALAPAAKPTPLPAKKTAAAATRKHLPMPTPKAGAKPAASSPAAADGDDGWSSF